LNRGFDAKNNPVVPVPRSRGEEGYAISSPHCATPLSAAAGIINAGLCRAARVALAGAEDYFEKALKARPNCPGAYQLADIFYARGE